MMDHLGWIPTPKRGNEWIAWALFTYFGKLSFFFAPVSSIQIRWFNYFPFAVVLHRQLTTKCQHEKRTVYQLWTPQKILTVGAIPLWSLSGIGKWFGRQGRGLDWRIVFIFAVNFAPSLAVRHFLSFLFPPLVGKRLAGFFSCCSWPKLGTMGRDVHRISCDFELSLKRGYLTDGHLDVIFIFLWFERQVCSAIGLCTLSPSFSPSFPSSDS